MAERWRIWEPLDDVDFSDQPASEHIDVTWGATETALDYVRRISDVSYEIVVTRGPGGSFSATVMYEEI